MREHTQARTPRMRCYGETSYSGRVVGAAACAVLVWLVPDRPTHGYERDTAERGRRTLSDPDTPAEDES